MSIRDIDDHLALICYLYNCLAVGNSFEFTIPCFDIIDIVKTNSSSLPVSYDNADLIIILSGQVEFGSYGEQTKLRDDRTITRDDKAGRASGELHR